MSKVDVLVSIEADHLDRFSEVVKSIKDAGMDVEQQMKEIGIVTGSIDSVKIERLRRLKGIAQVEKPHRFQIAPPNSELQ